MQPYFSLCMCVYVSQNLEKFRNEKFRRYYNNTDKLIRNKNFTAKLVFLITT